MDPLALLQHDHNAVRALSARLAEVTGAERLERAREIAAEVVLHAQLEEEFFYRALEQANDVEACQVAVDARAEHALVDDLIERLLGLDPRHGECDARSPRKSASSRWPAGRWARRAIARDITLWRTRLAAAA